MQFWIIFIQLTPLYPTHQALAWHLSPLTVLRNLWTTPNPYDGYLKIYKDTCRWFKDTLSAQPNMVFTSSSSTYSGRFIMIVLNWKNKTGVKLISWLWDKTGSPLSGSLLVKLLAYSDKERYERFYVKYLFESDSILLST